jgi:hypothetical protein
LQLLEANREEQMTVEVIRFKTSQDILNGEERIDEKNKLYTPVEIDVTLYAHPKAGKADVLNAIKWYLDNESNWKE